MRIVDLTRPLGPEMQVYPGDPRVQATSISSVAEDGCEVHLLSLGSQSGTHLDAPSHSLTGVGGTESIPLTSLIGRGVIVDVTDVPGGKPISPGPWAQVLRPGDFVAFRAGWDAYEGTNRAWDHPHLSLQTAELLIDAHVTAVGLDFSSPDPHGAILRVHHLFARAGTPIVENLSRLDQIDFDDPLLIVLPLAWPGLDGVPVRAIACDLADPTRV